MNKKENNFDVDVDVDIQEFDKMLSCIDSSEKSLRRLEKELFQIALKCAAEFLYRKKLSLVSKVVGRLSGNDLTRKAYQSKFLKAFGILTGSFVRDEKGNYYYFQNNALVVFLKKESIFLERIDLDDSYYSMKLEQCKELVRGDAFSSLSELYNLKTQNKAVDYSANFLKALISLEKNSSKIKGKNKNAMLEILEISRTLGLLPEKEEVDLVTTGQADIKGRPIKKAV